MVAFKKRGSALLFLLLLCLALNLGAPSVSANGGSAGVALPKHESAGPSISKSQSPLVDGQLDPTFGNGGKATTAFPGGFDEVRAMTLQSDGKVVIAGSAETRFVVGRYLSNGALDPAFGIDGLTKTDFGGLWDQANAVALQGDGKIVAGGFVASHDITGTVEFALARYNPSGSLDPTFGSDGKVVTAFPDSYDDRVFALAIQHDGKVVAGGNIGDSFAHFGLARYNPDGSLDSSFGTGGFAVTPVEADSQINAIAIQGDGKIVAAGRASSTAGGEMENDFALARYNPDGSLDLSFGTGGKVTTDFSGDGDIAYSVIWQPNGRIVAGGSAIALSTGESDFALARYSSNGTLDASFGSGGKVATDFGDPNPTYDVATALMLRTDGKILASGYSNRYPGVDFALARYSSNGSLDPAFGSGGKVVTDLGTTDAQANAALLQGDGKIVVGGYIERLGGVDFTLVRYFPGGTLDTSFGSDGVSVADGGAGPDIARGVVVQRDGRIVAAGSSSGIGGGDYGGGDFALARYSFDGSADPTFGPGGRVTTDFAGGHDGAYAMVLQPDQKIVAVGSYALPATYRPIYGGLALARYNSDGSLDTTFGSNGKVMTDLTGGQGGGIANAVVLQPDGKIVVAGMKWVGDCIRYCTAFPLLARYNHNGTLDPSFGNGGVVYIGFDGSHALALQDDGKLLAAGSWEYDFAVARYNPDGSRDGDFGNGGIVTTDFHNQPDVVRALAVQTDGKIVATGSSGNERCIPGYCLAYNEFGLARYNSDGTLDTSFGSGGKATTDLEGTADAQAMALQLDGKILVAGDFGFYGTQWWQSGFALVRYTPAGALDPSFGVGSSGTVTTTFGTQGAALSVVMQPDDRIVAAGQGTTEQGGYDFALARYTNAPVSRCPGERFFDVCPDDYFYTATLALADDGILSGYTTSPPCPAGISVPCFKPYNSSTRGQISKVVSLAAGFNDPVGTQAFEDVLPGSTFYTYTERMAERGIITGYTCGAPNEPCIPPGNRPYFRINRHVTRGQLSKMVSLAFNWNDPPTGQTFEDVLPGSTFYTYTERMAERGIITGYPCGGPNEPCVPPDNLPYFRSNNDVTRGQTAKIVQLARTQPTATPTATLVPASTATFTSVPSPTSTQPAPTNTPIPTSTVTGTAVPGS